MSRPYFPQRNIYDVLFVYELELAIAADDGLARAWQTVRWFIEGKR